MGYMQEVDRWLDVLSFDLADGKLSYEEMKKDIKERVLQSYKNGLKAAQSPTPLKRGSRREEAQPTRP